MKRAIDHRGFAFLNIVSPCVTWRGDDLHKEIRAKTRALPADHDVTSSEAALRFTGEIEHVTVGVLYEESRSSLVEQLAAIEDKARGSRTPPKRDDFLRAYQMQ